MLNTEAALLVLDWGLPIALGLVAAMGYLLGWSSNHSRSAPELPPKAAPRSPLAQMETLRELANTQPPRIDTMRPCTPGSAPRLAWCRLPGDVLELEGGSGHYIKVELTNVQPFVLRDSNHRLIRRGAELDMLMREGEHLARIDAAASAVMRQFVPLLRDR